MPTPWPKLPPLRLPPHFPPTHPHPPPSATTSLPSARDGLLIFYGGRSLPKPTLNFFRRASGRCEPRPLREPGGRDGALSLRGAATGLPKCRTRRSGGRQIDAAIVRQRVGGERRKVGGGREGTGCDVEGGGGGRRRDRMTCEGGGRVRTSWCGSGGAGDGGGDWRGAGAAVAGGAGEGEGRVATTMTTMTGMVEAG
ncbi:hypothetical protein KC19_9G016300 [Ceratodon purpureus]|uniref:Uncharacterized protein n=1 Tax=Ceratodon purpureus TaxID=3225 RepID=A0A8T0GRA6_CERPU|nr:hypothetical protein KC19_9G016300 [Ceratodon purpureus]